MSQIVWTKVVRPAPDEVAQCRAYDVYDQFDFRVPRTITLPVADEKLVELPEARTYGILSRAGLLLQAVGIPSRAELAPLLNEDPFSVGLYSAMQNGPEDYAAAKQMVDTMPEDFARVYRSLRSSKQFFRQIGNIPPSVLSIAVGIMGPQYVFSHSRWACLHALEQAEFDLQYGLVRAALVCSAFSLEDPLLSMRVRRSIPDDLVLCEGAAAVVLTPSSHPTDWRAACGFDEERFYGTAHDLVLLATRKEGNEEYVDRAGVVQRSGEGCLQCVSS